jgi:pimeloyl-ACP methyl ester carboxylesterase
VKTVLVYVHGLWFSGPEGLLLRRRLVRGLAAEARGSAAEDRAFSYPTVRATLAENAAALAAFLGRIETDRLHIVAHSLGGLVVWRSFQEASRLPPGRVVLLGSPLNGCRAGEGLARLPGGRRVMGRGIVEDAIGCRARYWQGARELGTVAGDRARGLGRLVARFDGPNDGTVAVAEARLAGAADHITLSVSHSGLLFAPRVAAQALNFFKTGRFDHRPARS